MDPQNIKRGGVASIRLASQHPGRCRGCGRHIILRSSLAGCVDDDPHCVDCMLEAAPAVGWALALIDEAGIALHGKWPKKADSRELEAILTVLRMIRPAFGKNRRAMSHRSRDAAKLLAAHLADTRALLLEVSRDLAAARQVILGPVDEFVSLIESGRVPEDKS